MILDIAAALAAGRNTCYNKKTPPAMKDISRLRRLSKENAFQFYAAGVRCATFEHSVPAPCFRHSFTLSAPEKASPVVAAPGFYELFVNGTRATRGRFSPNITNPDHILSYDTYDLLAQTVP